MDVAPPAFRHVEMSFVVKWHVQCADCGMIGEVSAVVPWSDTCIKYPTEAAAKHGYTFEPRGKSVDAGETTRFMRAVATWPEDKNWYEGTLEKDLNGELFMYTKHDPATAAYVAGARDVKEIED